MLRAPRGEHAACVNVLIQIALVTILCKCMVISRMLFSVGDAVAEGAVLVLDRLCAAGIVDDSQVGVLLAGCETHEPPAVVGRHVEAEGLRDVAFLSGVEPYQRLAQTACVTVGKTFAPEFDPALEPYLVFKASSSERTDTENLPPSLKQTTYKA